MKAKDMARLGDAWAAGMAEGIRAGEAAGSKLGAAIAALPPEQICEECHAGEVLAEAFPSQGEPPAA